MHWEFVSEIVLRSEDEGSCEWAVVFSLYVAAPAHSEAPQGCTVAACELQTTPRAGGEH